MQTTYTEDEIMHQSLLWISACIKEKNKACSVIYITWAHYSYTSINF